MGSESNEPDGDATPAERWRSVITWSSLLAAALVVYELTRQPALGVAALCLKFGWQDFKTARWLRRYDPWGPRGLACWWMYSGWGLLKVVLAAEAMSLLIGLIIIVWITVAGKPVLANEVELAAVGCCLTLVIGIGLCFVTTLTTMVVAYRNGLSLWLNSSTSYGRRCKTWPPYNPRLPQRNYLGLLFLAFSFCLFCLAPMLTVMVSGLPLWCIYIPIIGWLPVTRVFSHLVVRLIAPTPGHCWPPDELAAESVDPVQ